jgi:hypothetical protein
MQVMTTPADSAQSSIPAQAWDTIQQASGNPPRDRPPASAVVAALLEAETAAKQQRLTYPEPALLGDWRLHFASRGKVKLGDPRLRGIYFPTWLPAQIGFHPATTGSAPLTISNQVQVGLVQLQLTGPARYQERNNLLAFDFHRIRLEILGQPLYQGRFPSRRPADSFMDTAIGQLPFFSFFLISDRCIAARGRGGGLALWVKC